MHTVPLFHSWLALPLTLAKIPQRLLSWWSDQSCRSTAAGLILQRSSWSGYGRHIQKLCQYIYAATLLLVLLLQIILPLVLLFLPSCFCFYYRTMTAVSMSTYLLSLCGNILRLKLTIYISLYQPGGK